MDLWPNWDDCLKTMQSQMTRQTYDFCLRGSVAHNSNSNLYITARSEMAAEWLEHRLASKITDAITQAGGCFNQILYRSPQRPLLEDDVSGAYLDRRMEIIKPDKVEVFTQYFRRKWRPLLGPVASELVRELRQRAYFNKESGERRDMGKCTLNDLAYSLGVNRKTIYRLLERDEHGNFKKKHLANFILEMNINKIYNPDIRKVVNANTRFIIALDEPLTPDDELKLAPSKSQNAT